MMKIVLGLITLGLFTSALALAKTEIKLSNEVRVGTVMPLMLEDLISGNQVPADLLNIEVPIGKSDLSREDLLQWLKKSKAEMRELSGYAFIIPDSIHIEKDNPLSKDQISKRAQNRLLQKCHDCDFRIQLKNIPQISSEKVRIEWREMPLSGPFMVSVTNNDGQNLAWISGQIRTERPVVKASRVLNVGDTIQTDDIRLERTDISYNKDYYTDLKQVLGRKIARTLSASTTLASVDIQRNYDVKQGQQIRVISGNEVFEITSQGIAQDSGVIGDVIRVRNTANQKILSGRIHEKGLVRIE